QRVAQAPEIDVQLPVPAYRLPASCEHRSYQLTGITPAGARFTIDELRTAFTTATDIDYSADPAEDAPHRRLLARDRSLYRGDDLAALPFGQQGSLGLPFQTYRLAFTQPVIDSFYAGTITTADLQAAGYLRPAGEDGWW